MVAYVRLTVAGSLSRRQAPMSHSTGVRTTLRDARTLGIRRVHALAVG
jgi:hypothetical protein